MFESDFFRLDPDLVYFLQVVGFVLGNLLDETFFESVMLTLIKVFFLS